MAGSYAASKGLEPGGLEDLTTPVAAHSIRRIQPNQGRRDAWSAAHKALTWAHTLQPRHIVQLQDNLIYIKHTYASGCVVC